MPFANGYAYRRVIDIDRSKCGTADSLNFPVLVSGTYPYLATIANGGKVTNASGFDIAFFADANGTVRLQWDLESYTSTTGAIVVWVTVPVLSASRNTQIWMFYGNPNVTASVVTASNAWDSSYKGVWHLQTVTGGGSSVIDSSATGNNGTPNGSPTNITGQVAGGAGFTGGSSQYLAMGTTGLAFAQTNTFSLEFWLKTSTDAQYLMGSDGAGSGGLFVDIGNQAAAHKIGFGIQNSANNAGRYARGGTTVDDGTWRHVMATYSGNSDASGWLIYLNGVAETLTNASNATSGSNNAFRIGGIPYPLYSTCNLDEVRVSNAVRAASWAAAGYNSQNSPSTFYWVGPEDVGFDLPGAVLLTPAPQPLLVPRFNSALFRLASNAQNVVVPLLDASATLFTPSVAQAVALPVLDASATLFEPSVTVGSVSVVVPLLDASPTLFSPAVTEAVSVPLLDASPTLFAPSVAQQVSVPLLDAAPTLFAPAVSQSVAVPLLDAAATLHQPSVSTGSVNVVVPVLDASATLFQPTVTQAVPVQVPLLDASPTLFAPAVRQAVSVPLLNAAATLHSPSVSTTTNITVPLLNAAATLFAPAVSSIGARNVTWTVGAPIVKWSAGAPRPKWTAGATTP